MKKLLVAVVVACGFAAFANEWYVDPVNGNDLWDGTSSNHVGEVESTIGPRRTLIGIMELVGKNDTIWMLPGDYAEGTVDAADDDCRRLEIVGKSGLKFRSTAGRDKTFIVGQHDGASGYDGENAIGGVKLSGGSANCVFEGVTFRDCAANLGGGCRDLTKSCWFIGCSFTNCLAVTGGAMLQGNASGTEFVDCSGTSDTMNSMIGYQVGTMEFCLFRHINGTGRYLFQNGGMFINCTAYGMAPVYSGPVCFYNSLVFGAANNGAYQADVLYVTNSWLGVAKFVDVGENARTNANERAVRFVSPAMDDFRLTDLSEVTELGDAAYLALSPFPEGFVRKDVYGNPVTATSGAIPAGCALEVVHQTGPRVDFSGEFEVQDLDCTFNSGDYFNSIRENGDDYTYMIRPVTANNVIYVKHTIKEYYFPLRQKGGWVPVGVLPGLYSTNTFSFSSASAANTYYADPINGNDDYDGKSSNVVSGTKGPFKTLMGAMKKIDTSGNANKVTMLYLMPGTYAEGQTEHGPTSTKVEGVTGVCYRVCIGNVSNMAIVGLEGPEKTFIVGAPDPDTGGIGPNAVGGVWLKSGTVRVIQGVTITGCYSTDFDSTSYLVGGCAFFGGGSTTTFCYDCIISNNVGNLKPAQSYGCMSRCKILNNRAKTGLTDWGSVSSCVFGGNTIESSKNLTGVTSYGCTFDTPTGVEYGNKQYSYYSLVLNHAPASANKSYFKQSCTDTIPLVADQEAFDYRLGTLSPAILFGDVSERNATSTYRLVCDVDGNRLQIKDGKMTVGAVHGGSRAPCVAIANGGVKDTTVTGGEFGTNVVKSAGEVTLTAARTRPLEGFSVNGEDIPTTGFSYTFTPSAEPDAATFVAPVYGTNWFVSASAASDDAPGGTPETARQTIRSASTNAVAGDVIHVAPGTYGEKEGAETVGSYQLKNRVILPQGVTLRSDEGAAKTFIVGADDPDPARCVYANKNARICGFTLTGGHTLKGDSTSADDRYAAMVHSPDGTVRVEDCIITNNTTWANGLYNGRIIRCLVVDNYTSNPDYGPSATTGKAGTAGYGNYWYGCIIDRIKTAYPICSPKRIESCTLGPTFGGSQFVDTLKGNIYNTVYRGGRTYKNDYATNCLILATISTIGNSETIRETCGGSIFTNAAAMKFDENYCPVLGSNAGIDAGEVKYASSYLGDKDIYGNPRVLNGKMDIGAVEYDWRGRYREDLGARVTAVTEASPAVVETEERTVRIPSGTLVGKFKLSGGTTMLNFKVQGGTLTVYIGEKRVGEFGAADAKQSVELASDESDEFRLVFEPSAADGYAEIDRLTKGTSGIIFIVR